MKYEEMLKQAINEIDALEEVTKGEGEQFVRGILAGFYIALDYATFEKLEAEITKYVDERYDIFIF